MAGVTLPARELRALAPRTLLFSGTKTITNGTAATTPVDTLANVVDDNEIAWALSGGVLTLPAGGFFLVTLTGVFSDNLSGNTRRVHLQGAPAGLGSARLAPFVNSGFSSAGTTNLHVTGTIPLVIQPGEELRVFGRQDSGGDLSVTVWLGFVQLPVAS